MHIYSIGIDSIVIFSPLLSSSFLLLQNNFMISNKRQYLSKVITLRPTDFPGFVAAFIIVYSSVVFPLEDRPLLWSAACNGNGTGSANYSRFEQSRVLQV